MIDKTTTNPWVPWPSTNANAPLRLFCFPYAGGGASVFRSWARGLPPEIDLCPVQFPGRERRLMEEPYTHLSPLVADAKRALLPYLKEPFAFFGHCLGALVAFELSHQLREAREPMPIALFLSGHRAPHLRDRFPPAHQLPEPEFIAELRHRNGTREEVLQNPAVMRLVLPLLRADFAVCETYTLTSREKLACPFTIFGGDSDPAVLPVELVGWAEQTTGSCSVHILPGDHFFLQTARTQLLQQISEELSQLLSGLPSSELSRTDQ